jgi:hypothetical protein
MTKFAGTWKRLEDDTWGVWIESLTMPKYGDKVTVTRKDNKFSIETIEEVVSEPPGAFIVSVLVRNARNPELGDPDEGDPDDYGHN